MGVVVVHLAAIDKVTTVAETLMLIVSESEHCGGEDDCHEEAPNAILV